MQGRRLSDRSRPRPSLVSNRSQEGFTAHDHDVGRNPRHGPENPVKVYERGQTDATLRGSAVAVGRTQDLLAS